MIAQGWYTGVAACTRVNASCSRNTLCKLQRSSSNQCTSSVVSVSDHAKCASRAACMHTRFQRCFGSQPSIIQQASALEFIRFSLVCLSLVSWIENPRAVQLKRFGIPQLIFLPGNFWFWGKTQFFFTKNPYVAIFYCSGWLVGWL